MGYEKQSFEKIYSEYFLYMCVEWKDWHNRWMLIRWQSYSAVPNRHSYLLVHSCGIRNACHTRFQNRLRFLFYTFDLNSIRQAMKSKLQIVIQSVGFCATIWSNRINYSKWRERPKFVGIKKAIMSVWGGKKGYEERFGGRPRTKSAESAKNYR